LKGKGAKVDSRLCSPTECEGGGGERTELVPSRDQEGRGAEIRFWQEERILFDGGGGAGQGTKRGNRIVEGCGKGGEKVMHRGEDVIPLKKGGTLERQGGERVEVSLAKTSEFASGQERSERVKEAKV